MLTEVRVGVISGAIVPNRNNGLDHVYKIAAHAGKHSEGGVGKIKVAIQEMLDTDGFDYFA